MRTYLTALMLIATLGLVSCGGGNDGASTGTPVVAQATIWTPESNGGCGNSWNYDGNGPPLNPPQQCACNNALKNATVTQCTALGGLGNSLGIARHLMRQILKQSTAWAGVFGLVL